MNFQLITAHPIAVNSLDHLYPRGTAKDNSVSLSFNRKLYAICDHQVAVLDLGCAGGGMVKSLIDQGQIAVGLEGSDYSLVHHRAEWANIPGYLFTCDVSQPFILHTGDMRPFQFDVITAWEVLEHIEETDLPRVILNIKCHIRFYLM